MRTLAPAFGDMTAALQARLDEGPGLVRLEAGVFRCSGVRIPAGVVLAGEGPATMLQRGDGEAIIAQQDTGDWAVRDLLLDGRAEGEWSERADVGHHGIVITGGWGYEMTGVVVRNVAGAGVRIARTRLFTDDAPFCNGGNLDRLTVSGCHVGLCFDTRGEYLNATALSAYHNVTGVVIHAGNVKLSASNICTNVDGIYIEDHANGSHGAIGNCLINHNLRHALWCRNVRHGMTVQNCGMFYGDLLLEDSQGVQINGCELCCHVFIRGGGVNSLTHNYLIPHPGVCAQFEVAPQTVVAGNFTAKQQAFSFAPDAPQQRV